MKGLRSTMDREFGDLAVTRCTARRDGADARGARGFVPPVRRASSHVDTPHYTCCRIFFDDKAKVQGPLYAIVCEVVDGCRLLPSNSLLRRFAS